MQNKLKSATVGVIEQLNTANIRIIMATGDNVLTAISVGRECKIVQGDLILGDVNKIGTQEFVSWTKIESNEIK